LRTKKSSGIGEFYDLIPLIDWCKSVGFDCIQLLPINDSGEDPSPYNAVSSCALDPIYISLSELGIEKGHDFSPLNQTQRVLRKEVLKRKLPLLKEHYKDTFESLKETQEYKIFVEENPWLGTYTLFKVLKENLSELHCFNWPTDYPDPNEDDLHFMTFLQFHAFRQMKQVYAYAQKQKVFLIGDIPILLSPDSADIWVNRVLFDMSFSAGAPPDDFTPLGQNWGFPLFDRDAMRENGFAWWKRRLKLLDQFFDIYRIDHVLGLFRIWAMQEGEGPDEGSFIPKNRDLWVKNGTELLQMFLETSPLLPIAEDLGTVTKEITTTLKKLEVAGTKLIWMTDDKKKLVPFEKYGADSMTTVSTHDTPTLALWWRIYPKYATEFAKLFDWEYDPILTPERRFKVLHKAHHTQSLFHVNLLQEYLALFPELVWLNPEDERINVPGTLLPKNWTYRFRPYLEEIADHTGLKAAIAKLLKK